MDLGAKRKRRELGLDCLEVTVDMITVSRYVIKVIKVQRQAGEGK